MAALIERAKSTAFPRIEQTAAMIMATEIKRGGVHDQPQLPNCRFAASIKLNPKYAGPEEKERRKWYRIAIEQYKEVLKMQPHFTPARFNLGVVYFKIGEYGKAIECYNKAIELRPDMAKMYVNRGNAYACIEQYDNAISDFNMALRRDPKSVEAYNGLGHSRKEQGDYDRAVDEFIKAIHIKPQDPDLFFGRGSVFLDAGKYDDAVRDFNKAIELNPKDAGAFNNLGIAYVRMNQMEEGIRSFEKAIELNPKDAGARKNLGAAYFIRGCQRMRRGRWSRAKMDLEAAKENGMDIAAEFADLFGSAAEFEARVGVPLLPKIAELLNLTDGKDGD